MKAQLSFDFVLSISIFIIFLSYIVFQLLYTIPRFRRWVEVQNLRGKAFSISQILLNDFGYPTNWHELDLTQIKRIGLKDETKNLSNFLSFDKITRLNQICSDYQTFKSLLGIDKTVIISIKDLVNNQTLASCSPEVVEYRAQKVSLKRNFAFSRNGEVVYGEMEVEVL